MSIVFMKPYFFVILFTIPLIWISLGRWSNYPPAGIHKFLTGGLRTLLAILLTMILADPRLAALTDRVNLFYCMDLSHSVAEDQLSPATDFIKKTSATMDPEDQAGLIVFGDTPSVEMDLQPHFTLDRIRSEVNKNFSDAAKALQLATGILPRNGKGRIVLLSDGNTPDQALMDAAYTARSMGVEIYPVPLNTWYGKSEVYIPAVSAPEITPLETPFNLEITVMSGTQNNGELVLMKNSVLFAKRQVSLAPGKNTIKFADILKTHGLYHYKAVINAGKDTVYENNEYTVFTRGTRKSSILYIAPAEKSNSPLLRALHQQGLNVIHQPTHSLTFMLRDLAEHHCVILDNVPSHALSYSDMEQLNTYVRDFGGGLIMIGGHQSFGAGKYGKTPIEKALPVFIDMPSELEYPSLILILIIDKSSSMTGHLGNASKLEMAKIAAFSAAERLNPVDKLGILAFDMTFKWTVPITRIEDLKPVADSLSMLAEDGGTTLFPALEESYRVLKSAEASKKHVIILSDGLIEEANFNSLIENMNRNNITITTVAIGKDSDIALMASIAEWGGGRSYYTNDAETVPKIFVDETRIASETAIIEQNIQPRLQMRTEIIKQIDADRWPAVDGQVMTYMKPDAREILSTDKGPLLAAWQYGLGKSTAFTSDLSEKWGKQWVLWNHYGQFVSQMVKWTQRKESDRRISADIRRNGNEAFLTVDVTDKMGRYANLLNLGVNVLPPLQNEKQSIALNQTAPGRYQAAFPATQVGEYYLSIHEKGKSAGFVFPTLGYTIPYSEEYENRETNTALLKKIATLTGGRILSASEPPKTLFSSQTSTKQYDYRLWPIMIVVFLFLFSLEIGIRKWLSLRSGA